MASLVSAGVSVTISDQSAYIPGAVTSVPLIIIATQDQKLQTNGQQALGTFEYGVLRTVTSISNSLQLYGVPNYLVDANNNPQYGDCRSEYGLDALNKFLLIGNSAIVLRANVNLNDTPSAILSLWNSSITTAASDLNTLVSQYITEYNAANGYVPADSQYAQTVTQSELITLLGDALSSVLDMYSFSSTNFNNDFLQDHTVEYPSYQDAIYTSTNGYITTADNTGLANDTTLYGFVLDLSCINGDYTAGTALLINVEGENCQTFGDLISQLQTAIDYQSSSNTTVTLIQGRIRITSDLAGATSNVNIASDGYSGVNPLFANTNLFSNFAITVPGQGIQSLDMYDPTYTQIIGGYNGLYGMVNAWSSGSVISNQFTPQEAQTLLQTAATDFSETKQFVNDSALGANDAARRAVIVTALGAAINDPTSGIYSQNVQYNLVICPGFPEVSTDLVTLSTALQEEVFVIGETPFAVPPTGPNSLTQWATTTGGGYVASYDIAYYYPHALSTNIDGTTILTTAASCALYAFAYNDQVAAVWYAAAGVNRGKLPFASTIGYVSGTLGQATTFVDDYMDQGDRDTIYQAPIQVNPITYDTDNGIYVFGNTTTYGATTSLLLVHVSRLLKYIKRQIRKSQIIYLFEPNDNITWANVQALVNTFLGTLLSRRALYDFATDVSGDDNTAATIAQRQLYVDIAVQPEIDVEFIYDTITVAATGASLTGTA